MKVQIPPKSLRRLEQAILVFRPEVSDRQLRRWVVRLWKWEQSEEKRSRPQCAACGLIKGIGFLDIKGTVSQADPQPLEHGYKKHGHWFCTFECVEEGCATT